MSEDPVIDRRNAKRFVRSINEECLDRLIMLGERHLRRTLSEFVVHYHAERNHQGLDNELISAAPANECLKVRCAGGDGWVAC
jgi:hypothetical protein